MTEPEKFVPMPCRRPLNLAYKEILRLSEMLTRAHISHVLERRYDGWKLVYVDADGKCYVAEHFLSYGHEDDRLEIMGLLTDDEEHRFNGIMGHLTAEDVFQRIKARHERG